MVKRGPENIETRKLVAFLEATGRKNKARVWLAMASLLQKPSRSRPELNLYRLNKVSKQGDVVATPAKLLGNGSLDHAVTIAAFAASASAREGLAKAGGKLLSIRELVESNPSGKGVRLLK